MTSEKDKPTLTVLSLDIGTKNFGFTLIRYHSGQFKFFFNTFDLDTQIDQRYTKLKGFIQKCVNTYKVSYVFIEKQVNRNIVAMCLMYMVFSISCEYVPVENVKLFIPLDKFKVFSLPYCTEKKKHKKQSVEYALNFLSNTHEKSYDKLQGFKKKDDIADSLNQGLVGMFTSGLIPDVSKERMREYFISEKEKETEQFSDFSQ